MSQKHYSKLAKPVESLRKASKRIKNLHGICIHTTGTGVISRAFSKWRGISTPIGVAIEIYSEDNFPHYVIDTDGSIFQVADEEVRAWHAGLYVGEIRSYKLQSWARRVDSKPYSLWSKVFVGSTSPLDLFPGTDPNEFYIGIELIPTSERLYTEEQYKSLAAIISDIWQRHDLPSFQDWQGTPWVDHWEKMRRQGRLVGHEDLQAFRRWDSKGGWDPGALREQPRFFWDKLFKLLGDVP